MSDRFDTVAALAQCDAAEERAAKATPGPWELTRDDGSASEFRRRNCGDPTVTTYKTRWAFGRDIAAVPSKADAAFIAAARTDVPDLAARLRAAVAEIDRLSIVAAELRDALAGLNEAAAMACRKVDGFDVYMEPLRELCSLAEETLDYSTPPRQTVRQ